MDNTIKKLGKYRIIPVESINHSRDAMSLSNTLCEGGLPVAEITLRTDAAIDAIRVMVKSGDVLVGAGTVLTIDQVRKAVDVGARFVISPGFNLKVAKYCVDNKILHIPGVCTPSEIQASLDLGLDVLKFFPAQAFGGLKTLKAICAPYQDIKFIPTGGIHPGNIVDYLEFPNVLACGGSWIAKSESISAHRFDEILQNIKEAVMLAQNL